MDRLSHLLRTRSGLVLGPDKLYLLETRLAALLRRHCLENLAELAALIEAQGEAGPLACDVVEAMTTNETSFFRDGRPFEHLRSHGLPRLMQGRLPGHPLRVWSAASSSGQEAYSIAMVLADNGDGAPPAVIIGTDIARAPIAQARLGQYTPFQVQRGLDRQHLQRHFTLIRTPEGDRWQVLPHLLAMCEFHTWNLLDDLEPLGHFDVVFCRNVLMYFDDPTKSRVLANIARRLRPGGLLYLGGAETASGASCLAPYEQERGVYQRAVSSSLHAP